MSAFGDTLRHQVAGMAMEVAGLDGSDARAGAAAAAARAGRSASTGGAFFGGGTAGGGGPGGGPGMGLDPALPFLPPGSGDGGAPGGGGTAPAPGMCPAASRASAQATAPACGDRDMALSAAGEQWLRTVETLALTPYDDQTGKPITSWVKGATIGYGHLISRSEWELYKDGITAGQAEMLFQQDVAPFVARVNSVIQVELAAHEFDALVMLAYNIGQDGFATSSVAKMINDPLATTSYPTLEAAWKAWNRSQGEVNNGLINRRAAEWDMYADGVYRHW